MKYNHYTGIKANVCFNPSHCKDYHEQKVNTKGKDGEKLLGLLCYYDNHILSNTQNSLMAITNHKENINWVRAIV